MSQAVATADVDVEEVVVSRSQYNQRLHRPDPDADGPEPACVQADADRRGEWREASLVSQRPHRRLCQNPGCFGGEWW